MQLPYVAWRDALKAAAREGSETILALLLNAIPPQLVCVSERSDGNNGPGDRAILHHVEAALDQALRAAVEGFTAGHNLCASHLVAAGAPRYSAGVALATRVSGVKEFVGKFGLEEPTAIKLGGRVYQHSRYASFLAGVCWTAGSVNTEAGKDSAEKCVLWLLGEGADPNHHNASAVSAALCGQSSERVLKALLAHGANFSLFQARLDEIFLQHRLIWAMPLAIAGGFDPTLSESKLLNVAAIAEKSEITQVLLLAGCNPNAEQGRALREAVLRNSVANVRLLLTFGANPLLAGPLPQTLWTSDPMSALDVAREDRNNTTPELLAMIEAAVAQRQLAQSSVAPTSMRPLSDNRLRSSAEAPRL